uniref:Macaca fascicularis brain cDNA clone: QflA-18342, similar to human ectonucleotide pyrophosphatase/phosphodiesterase 6(ENPP6), mRNA, RefSeq: NM_153343.2 n=1 Tax=Macaca fascicularis TaxID=9541 RepID=I7G5Q4_MACFA|nr:unnamed protein product [Macaca fascicularis]
MLLARKQILCVNVSVRVFARFALFFQFLYVRFLCYYRMNHCITSGHTLKDS